MKKICFIFGGNIIMCPYLNVYLKQLNEDCKFDVVYWNRYSTNKEYDYYKLPDNKYIFDSHVKSKIQKITSYIKYSNFIRDILSKEKYDIIIFLQTNMAILSWKYILQNKEKKYLIDIRDYSNEKNLVIKKLEDIIFNYANLISISSEGYKCFLPKKYQYKIVHNLQNEDMMLSKQDFLSKKDTVPIKIGYIGNMKLYANYLCKVANLFKNDSRFRLVFIGIGSEKIANYCKLNGINNIYTSGEYMPNETNELYKKIDVVNNMYGNNDNLLDYAISNKFYLAVQFALPILACPNTYTSEMIKKYNLGFTLDINNVNAVDDFYDWYQELDKKSYYDRCEMFNSKVVEENKNFIKNLNLFFYKEEKKW